MTEALHHLTLKDNDKAFSRKASVPPQKPAFTA
jgi:hypothetical protein